MSYTLLSETTPKARKEHRCIWCGEPILVGERYRCERSVYDGQMQYHKWHLECNAAANEHFRHCIDDTFGPGEAERPTVHLGFQKDEN